MRRFTTIDNEFVLKHGLTLQEAYLFVWFYSLPSWAESITYNQKTYFFASKNKACEDLPVLTTKPDTMYRYYKKLQKYGFIEVIKLDGKDYVTLTAKAKLYNKSDSSDVHPNNLGQSSESNSDNHPTYSNINYIDNNNSKNSASDEIINFTDSDEKQIDLFGNGPEKEKEKKVPAKKEKVSNEIIFPLVRELSKHFDKRILDNLSKSDKKNWCDTVEKLIRIDGYTHEEIKRAVKNARSDSFWSDKFLSLVKLRKKKPGEPTYIERFLRLNKTNDDNIGSNNFVYNPSKKANLL